MSQTEAPVPNLPASLPPRRRVEVVGNMTIIHEFTPRAEQTEEQKARQVAALQSVLAWGAKPSDEEGQGAA